MNNFNVYDAHELRVKELASFVELVKTLNLEAAVEEIVLNKVKLEVKKSARRYNALYKMRNRRTHIQRFEVALTCSSCREFIHRGIRRELEARDAGGHTDALKVSLSYDGIIHPNVVMLRNQGSVRLRYVNHSRDLHDEARDESFYEAFHPRKFTALLVDAELRAASFRYACQPRWTGTRRYSDYDSHFHVVRTELTVGQNVMLRRFEEGYMFMGPLNRDSSWQDSWRSNFEEKMFP